MHNLKRTAPTFISTLPATPALLHLVIPASYGIACFFFQTEVSAFVDAFNITLFEYQHDLKCNRRYTVHFAYST